MRRLVFVALISLAGMSFVGPALAHEEAPAAACNGGTHHAHEMVPAGKHAHHNIPEHEHDTGECVHEAHEE